MPDFNHKSVHEFWHGYQDQTIYRVVCFMEGVEDWTLDGDPEFEAALSRLATTLDDIGNIDLQLEEKMLELLAFTKTGRGLRLLMTLDMAYPGAAAKILMHAEKVSKSDRDVPGFFLRRNIVFERLRLLGRVFSAERTQLVLNALEEHG